VRKGEDAADRCAAILKIHQLSGPLPEGFDTGVPAIRVALRLDRFILQTGEFHLIVRDLLNGDAADSTQRPPTL